MLGLQNMLTFRSERDSDFVETEITFHRVWLKTGCQEEDRQKLVECQFNLFHLQSLFMLHLLLPAPLTGYSFNSFDSTRTLIDVFEKLFLKSTLEVVE